MNKKLLAVAVGAALSAPMLAQAAVTVGGQAHMSADYVDTFDATAPAATTVGTNSRKVWNISSNVSNIFVKGEEDLGGGMKGVFFLQQYFRLDDNGGATQSSVTSSNRMHDAPAYAGLSTGFGTVLLGNQDSPTKLNNRAVDLFNNQIGDTRNVGMDNTRMQNSASYVTPTFAGVTVGAFHSTNLDNLISSSSSQTVTSVGTGATNVPGSKTADELGVKFEQGPLAIGFAYGQAVNRGAGANVASTTYGTLPYADQKIMNLGASFKIGPARIVGAYQDNKAVGNQDGVDQTAYSLGGAFTFGNETIKAQYASVTRKAAGTVLVDVSSKVMAVGYDHAFSKTFTGYAAYAKSSNDNGAGGTTSMAGGGGHGDTPNVATGQDQSGLSVGFIFNF
jgi:predicted porin